MRIGSATMFAAAPLAAALTIAGGTAIAQSPSISVAGCVQKESSVLKRTPIAGNVGMDDEFVLTNSKPASAEGADPAKPDAAPEPAGAAGSASGFGTVYRLTGDKEKELKSYVGQRVEITGSVKEKEKTTDAMSSIGTSGKAGDLTPSNTAEITIDAIKPVGGACSPEGK